MNEDLCFGFGSMGAFAQCPCWFPTSPPAMTPTKSQPSEGTTLLKRVRLTGQVDDHPALFIGLGHAGLGSIQLSSHLLHLPKEQVGQTLKHDCVWSGTDEPRAFVVPREIKAVAAFLIFNHSFFSRTEALCWILVGTGRLLVQI